MHFYSFTRTRHFFYAALGAAILVAVSLVGAVSADGDTVTGNASVSPTILSPGDSATVEIELTGLSLTRMWLNRL